MLLNNPNKLSIEVLNSEATQSFIVTIANESSSEVSFSTALLSRLLIDEGS